MFDGKETTRKQRAHYDSPIQAHAGRPGACIVYSARTWPTAFRGANHGCPWREFARRGACIPLRPTSSAIGSTPTRFRSLCGGRSSGARGARRRTHCGIRAISTSMASLPLRCSRVAYNFSGLMPRPSFRKRFEEGYGITPPAFERAKAFKPDLIVTVDCGGGGGGGGGTNHFVIIDGFVSSLTLSVSSDVRKSNSSHNIHSRCRTRNATLDGRTWSSVPRKPYRVIRKWRNESHDRWLIIDDSLYHCGHSLNANGGHKISAIALMGNLSGVDPVQSRIKSIIITYQGCP